MKLIIQIPCLNEEKTLESVLKNFPKKIDGISEIKTMIIDDGSSDKTVELAEKLGVDFIIIHKTNAGLGNAFASGVNKFFEENGDILVNTDGDNQYPGEYIKDLVKPIIDGKADIVIGDRQTAKIEHFSFLKKFFQFFGSFVVRFLSGIDIPDSVSGFRAYSKESLYKINITSDFSYAIDTLVQAGSKKLKVEHIKIHTNKPTRPSRLFKNMFEHMTKSANIILRVYAMYNPLRIFIAFSIPFFVIGSLGILRFLYFYFFVDSLNTGKVQSLLIAGVCLIIGFQFLALGIIGDLIGKNRRLIEDNLYLSKKNYFSKK